MNQLELFKPTPRHKFEFLSKEDLIKFVDAQQSVIESFQKDNERLRNSNEHLKQKSFYIDEQYVTLKSKLFDKSSEKEGSSNPEKKKSGKKGKRKKKVQLPSSRYPDAPIIDRDVVLDNLPSCSCCGHDMQDSGMTEDSEFLTVLPAHYYVIRQKRHKYRCGKCHSSVKTAPCPPRVKPGSSYSDEMMLDVALSKYCDLIPIERYAAIAGRGGVMGIPPQSLILLTHNLSDFVEGAYFRLKDEIVSSKVIHADETPHRMLEDNDKKSWYLWGFSTSYTSYFEIHNTRSGDVASEILKTSKCEFLISDVFSGYKKAVRESNRYRIDNNLPILINVYCNAHSRRKFKEAQSSFSDEAQFFIDIYKKIYRLEKIAKARAPDRVLRVRRLMKPLFELIKARAIENVGGYSTKSGIGKAMNYFLKNYNELTLFVDNSALPIDNNSQESLLRSPVVGRKTWYGTHSKRGARTTAILFSLVQSCKLNKVNPREYFKKLVQDLHNGKKPYTPKEYKDLYL